MRPLWADRNFSVFWAGQTCSALGTAFALVALPLLVLQATGSVAQMGLITGVAGAATIITGIVAGAVVDRVDRRRLMIGCDVARTVLFGAVPVAWLFGSQVWLLYVAMAAGGALDMLFKVAYVAAVPGLVGTDRIVEANGRLETTNAVSTIAGPMLAGVVSAAAGPTVAIAVDAASFAVSAIALLLTRFGTPSSAAAHRGPGSFLTGFRYLWRTPVLRSIMILLVVVSFVSVGMTDVLVFDVHTALGAGDAAVGLVLGTAGVGTVIAAALLPLLRRTLGFGPCWIGAYVLCGLAVLVLASTAALPAVAGAALVYAFCMGLAGISSMSLRQAITPSHLLGRVTSAFWTVHGALGPVGAAVLTGLVGVFGVRGPLLAVAAAFLGVAAIALATPIRRRHPERQVPRT